MMELETSIYLCLSILLATLLWYFFTGRKQVPTYVEHDALPNDLLKSDVSKWSNLQSIEEYLGAKNLRSCYDQIIAHEKISFLDPEYVNIFTVQHNLFAGALLSLSVNKQHVEIAEAAKEGKQRGCFALTENAAGVYSGAIVNTELRSKGTYFELHTPNEDADKIWISYANDNVVTWIIVFAKFIDNRGQKGSKRNNIVVPLIIKKELKGVHITPYVEDQAVFCLNKFGRIKFDHVKVEFSALMNKFVQWDAMNQKFVYDGSRRKLLYKLFNRLMVGRLVLSATAVVSVWRVLKLAKKHAQSKGFFNNLEVQQKITHIEKEAAVMQIRLYNAAKLLDNGKAVPYQINFLKAKIPPRCLALVSELGMMLGGRVIRESCPVLNIHGSVYGSIVAEGDSAILKQAFMKDIMMKPWLVSNNPVVWGLCLWGIMTMIGKKNKRRAWNQAQHILGAAFERINL